MASERWTKKRQEQLDDLLSFAPKEQKLTWDQVDHLSEERLWWIMRRFDRGDLMVLLERALGKVPVGQLESILEHYCFAGEVGESSVHVESDLNAAVRSFCKFANAGHYYEYIDYDGPRQSDGTHNFCARCQSLFARCIAESESSDPSKVVAAFEELIDLLRLVDDGHDNIVHFTDEAGSWQVGILWQFALPAYFRCLARVAPRAQFDSAVKRAIEDFAREDEAKLSAAAREIWGAVRAIVPGDSAP